jgi:hypothetical protein
MNGNPLPHLIDLTYAAMDAAQSTLSIQYTNHPEISITAYGSPKGTGEIHRECLTKWAATCAAPAGAASSTAIVSKGCHVSSAFAAYSHRTQD